MDFPAFSQNIHSHILIDFQMPSDHSLDECYFPRVS